MKIRPLAVFYVAIGVLAMWFAFGLGGGELSVHSAQPEKPTSGPKSIQTNPNLQQAAHPKDGGLGQPARVAIIEQDPEAADEMPLLDKGSKEAVLVVIAIDRATGDPIQNVRVTLLDDQPGYRIIGQADGHVGTFELAPVTDNTGEGGVPIAVWDCLQASRNRGR